MKRKLFLLLILFGLSGFQILTDEKCEFNLEINENWEDKLTEKSFPFDFVEKRSFLHEYDSTSMSKEEIFQEDIMTNNFVFTSDDEDSIEIHLTESVYHTPCAAYDKFKDAFFYYHTKWPQYEKSTHPCVYLVQNNKIFVISAPPGQEKLMETFMESFLKILLINSFREGSLFVRYTSSKAVLK